MPPTLLPRESDQFVQSSGMLHAVGSGRNQKDVLCILSLIPFYLDNAAAACRNGYHQYTCLFDLLCHNESFCKTMARMAFEINLQRLKPWASNNRSEKDLYVFFQLLLKQLFKRLDWVIDGLAPKHGLVEKQMATLRFFFMLFAYLSTQSLVIQYLCFMIAIYMQLGFREMFKVFVYGRFNAFCNVLKGQD